MSRRAAYRQDQLLPILGTCPQPYKIGYNLRSTADEALAATQAEAGRGHSYRREQRVYECSCGRYHLTSTELIDGEEMAKEPLYIPVAGSSLAEVTTPGAGIWASWRGGGKFLVDYAQNFDGGPTFADRVRQARDSQVSESPTAMRVTVDQESLTFIGHYDDTVGSVELLEDALGDLSNWLALDLSAFPGQLLTTDPIRTQARRNVEEEPSWI